MKKMKKLFAILMTMAMVMGLGITGFAAPSPGTDEEYGTSDDRGTITVSGITVEADNDNLEVVAYPIIQASYDETNKNFTGYTSLYESIIDEEVMADPVDNINQEILNDIIENLVKTTKYEMTSTNNDGTYTANVPVGSYLVIISGAETTVYNPVVVSVAYTNTNGSNDLTEGTVAIDETEANAWVKASSVPTVDKTVSDTSGDTENDVNGNSVNVGDSVTYDVTINPVPNYGGDHPVLNVVDTLSTGLTFNNDVSVKVYKNDLDTTGKELTLNQDYTCVYEDIDSDGVKELKVDFVINNAYKLNDYVGQKVVITYSATVNDKAVINEGGNHNDVVLNYTNDSKTTGNDGEDKDKTYTYTFDINGSVTGETKVLTKVGEGTEKNALKDAEFTLYTDKECNTVYDNDIFNGTATSDEYGQLDIKGLAAGTYYLKETKAPAGYSVNTHVFVIDIDATYNEDGTLATWKITIDGKETASFTVDHTSGTPVVSGDITGTEIKNTKLTALPSTGGMGTTLFTIAGCVIMISAAGLFFATRKKAN